MTRIVLSAFVLALAAVAATRACGPWFPNTYLAGGDESRVLAMPEGDFFHELCRLADLAEKPAEHRDLPSGLDTLATDLADLDQALRESGVADEARQAMARQYQAIREATRRAADQRASDAQRPGRGAGAALRKAPPPPEPAPQAALPARLPPEFALYARGAEAYHRGDLAGAVKLWQELLALPASERRYRSTWAAYMIARTSVGRDDAKAVEGFERTRELARAGHRDSLHLSEAGLGWQARAELNLGRRVEAMHHYFQMVREAGEPERTVGYTSLCAICRQALSGGAESLQDLAADPLCRRMVAAYVLSHHLDGGRWIEAVEKAVTASGERAGPGADRLAWAAYRSGRMDAAARWAAVADPQAPYARWVQSKLLLRAGKIDQALDLLRGLVAAFPADEAWLDDVPYDETLRPGEMVRSEAGVLLLGRRDYAAALDMLARGRFWADAAYVAERVLTVDELAAYVAARAGDADLRALPPRENEWQEPPMIDRLRYLLARRLARQGEWSRAQGLWPPQVQPDAERYVAAMDVARDAKRSDRDRAAALYRAARVVRTCGLELLGAELDPDWAVYGGDFEQGHTLEDRGVSVGPGELLDRQALAASLVAALSPSGDEKARGRLSAVQPYTRFHYRTLAAELMWQCGERLPDNDPLLARALWEGGTFLKDRDPQAADRFYKALVNRCRKLAIGQQADRLRWFPTEAPPRLPEAEDRTEKQKERQG